MSNVQSFKSQVVMFGNTMPMQLGGATLDWDRAWMIPDVAGNFSNINYAEGFQTPAFEINHVLLDGSAALCPISSSLLPLFLSSTSNPYNDVYPVANPAYFDGANGWSFGYCKPAQFTISGAKGQLVNFSATYAVYQPNGGTAPTFITSPPTAFTPFYGTPLSFAHCSFYTNSGPSNSPSSPLNEIVSWSLTYSNNLTPDMSMISGPGQQYLPCDMNAGIPTASMQISYTADSSVADHMSPGDAFKVSIVHGSVSVGIVVPSFLIGNNRSRNNQNPRVMRNYSGRCLGIGNNQNQYPVVITAS